jgi:4-amino-4-deoxy-L-arabinose transferase-like glycosyltransferase
VQSIPFSYFLLLIILFGFAITNEARLVVVFLPLIFLLLIDEFSKFAKSKRAGLLVIHLAIMLIVLAVFNGETAHFKYGPWMTFNNNIIFFIVGTIATVAYILIDKNLKNDSNSKAVSN